MVRDSSLSVKLLVDKVVHKDLIVVSRGDYFVLSIDNFETPDFTFEVRPHKSVLGGAILVHYILEFEN